MNLMTKFWRTKLTVVLLSIAAVFGALAALAWPEWRAPTADVTPMDEHAAALQYLAAESASGQPATVDQIRRVYVVRRHEPQQVVVISGEGGATAGDALAVHEALAAIPTMPVAPRPAPPNPSAPSAPRAPAPSAPTSPVTAPSTSAPPPPKPAAPAPAPARSKGS